jgi:TrpR-related protein YerC/YecD
MSGWNNSKTRDLMNVILAIQSEKEVKMFFRDLLTEKELLEFGNRWKAARMLDENIPYTQIIKKTGLSSTTVARISKWLQNGRGGYRLMLDRISNNHHKTLSRLRKG